MRLLTATPDGGAVGPVYSGELAGALARVVGGQPLDFTVDTAAAVETLDVAELLDAQSGNARDG